MVSLTTAERIMAIREGGWTDRMHTVLKNRSYRVDGHSWGVATLALTLFPQFVNKDLLIACLMHDVPERWVGDSPHPAKYNLTNGELGALLKKAEARIENMLGIREGTDFSLTSSQKEVLVFCDVLDFVLWAREEVQLGNMLMQGTFDHGMTSLRKMPVWEVVGDTVEEMLKVPPSESTGWWQEMMNVQK